MSKVYSRGSPPRVRGKDHVVQNGVFGRGITPACAGKRNSARTWSSVRQDHPRVCGEKSSMSRLFSLYSGSPPRMRGKGYGATIGEDGMRITPAYTGKSSFGLPSQTFTGDHPRVCGEKSHCVLSLYVVLGSPPRMRGKGVNPCNQRVAVRITPAYAGKSLHPPAEYILTGDHPRVCGEKGDAASYRAWRRGSPPRMRGKAPCWALRHITDGITPAYAGTRLMVTSHSARTWDHPRVCGEKWCVVAVLQIKQGSPPRMRGKVRCRRCP